MKLRKEYTCPLELTHDITKGKWKPMILWQLGKGSASFSELRKGIRGISEKILLQHLKELQEFDMVEKKQYEGYPLKTENFLTPRGKKMLQATTIMQEIGIELMLEDDKADLLKSKGFL